MNNEITISGEITKETAQQFKEQLKSYEGDVVVKINSEGGQWWAGVEVFNLLKGYEGEVVGIITGLAASAASYIYMACDHRVMLDGSFLMIHLPNASGVEGTSATLMKNAETLEKIEKQLVKTYVARSNLSEEEVVEALKNETWYSETEAYEAGFCDEISEQPAEDVPEPDVDDDEDEDDEVDDVAARAVRKFKNVPQQIKIAAKINSMLKSHNVKSKTIRKSKSIQEARKLMTDTLASRQPKLSSISFGQSQVEKTSSAMRYGLFAKAGLSIPSNHQQSAQQFQRKSLLDLARYDLRNQGMSEYEIDCLSRNEIAQTALGFGRQIGISNSKGYNTPGSLPTLLREVGDKSLLQGFEDDSSTWRDWVFVGPSRQDFRPGTRVRLNEVGSLDMWPDNTSPNEKELHEEEYTSAIEAHSNKVSFSYRSIVNDDLGALSDIPKRLGMAASRTVNRAVYQLLLSNPTVETGSPLFHEDHGNFEEGESGGFDYAEALQLLKTSMMKQRGPNNVLLGIRPAYVLLPPEIEMDILKVIQSTNDPLGDGSNQANPLHNFVKPVVDGSLSDEFITGFSETAFYLVADPKQYPSLELYFLQGQERPVSRFHEDPDTLSWNYYVLQSFVATISPGAYRGISKHSGE